MGHPSLDLTPGAFSLIQCARVETLVYTTGSIQQSALSRMHLLKTPAATYTFLKQDQSSFQMQNFTHLTF